MYLEWDVFIIGNNNKVLKYNVFDHYKFRQECDKAWVLYGNLGISEFTEEIVNILIHYFWAKNEWEIVITGSHDCDKFINKKVDVYKQITLNLEHFIIKFHFFHKYIKK